MTPQSHSCKKNVMTNADWKRIPKEDWLTRMCLVSRLSDWLSQQRHSCLFDNDEQVQGALKLAYQQYMDGCGKSVMHWIGITEDELAEWQSTGELPKKLRVKRSRLSWRKDTAS